jgi:hypothetical protein
MKACRTTLGIEKCVVRKQYTQYTVVKITFFCPVKIFDNFPASFKSSGGKADTLASSNPREKKCHLINRNPRNTKAKHEIRFYINCGE